MENEKIKILLADDNVHLRNFFKEKILSSTDFEVIAETDDGDEELKMILELKPDIVVTDLKRAKGISGYDVIKKYYDLGLSDVDFIVTTGVYYQHLFHDLQEMGVSYILNKPFDFERLIEEIYIVRDNRLGKHAEIQKNTEKDKNKKNFTGIIYKIRDAIIRK